jgi:diguanylate cyclase (GGDEF)-like protein
LADRIGCAAAALLSVSNSRVQLAGSLGIADPSGLADSEAVARVLRTGRPITVGLPVGVAVAAAVVDVIPRYVRILPVRAGVLTVGVLLVAWLDEPTRESTGVLQVSLPGLGVALNNALNHKDLQRVAALDPLTGAYNRRFGMQRLAEEFGRSARTGDPLGVLMMDLDHFKAVNDTYGHLVGDRVLQAVIRSARNVLREGDVFIRYGGEEFLLVLPGAGGADIVTTAERVRRAVAETDIVEAGQRIPVTVSVGGAGLPHPQADTPADLIGLADNAVYTAKDSGRDRCIIARQHAEQPTINATQPPPTRSGDVRWAPESSR